MYAREKIFPVFKNYFLISKLPKFRSSIVGLFEIKSKCTLLRKVRTNFPQFREK